MTLNYAAILVAAIAVFAFAAVYYSLMAPRGARSGAAWAQRRRPPPALVALELVKALIVAVVVAGLISSIGITDLVGAVTLAIALWVGFPVVLLIGSVTQENTPRETAAIHAGDWLAKLLIIAVIVGIWR